MGITQWTERHTRETMYAPAPAPPPPPQPPGPSADASRTPRDRHVKRENGSWQATSTFLSCVSVGVGVGMEVSLLPRRTELAGVLGSVGFTGHARSRGGGGVGPWLVKASSAVRREGFYSWTTGGPNPKGGTG